MTTLEERFHNLCRAHGVAVAYLFDAPVRGNPDGVAAAQVGLVFAGPAPAEAMPPAHSALLRGFRELFGVEHLDLTYLEEAGPVRRYQGVRGSVLYSADERRRAEFEDRVIRDYLDFAFEMRLFDEEVAEEIQDGDRAR